MLAAHRAGIKRIIVPERNRADLDEVPKEVQDAIEFCFVQKMDQVLEYALESKVKPLESKPDEVKADGGNGNQPAPEQRATQTSTTGEPAKDQPPTPTRATN